MISAPLALALIASLAAPQTPIQQTNPLHIKVVVATRLQIVQRDEQGAVTMRRGFIEPSQLNQITEAIKVAKATVEEGTGGRIQVSYDILVDADPYYVWVDPQRIWVNSLAKPVERTTYDKDSQIIGGAMAQEMVGPWLNEQGFANEVSTNYGPFAAAVLVHAGLTSERTDLVIHNTPVRVMSWTGFSQNEPTAAFAQELANLATTRASVPNVTVPMASTGGVGEFSSAAFNDTEVGSGLRIASEGIVPRGGVEIASGTGQTGFLTLRLRTKSNAPFAIIGLDEALQPLGTALFGMPATKPVEEKPVPTAYYPVPGDNKWHTLSIPLADLGGTPAHIWVALHPYAKNAEYPVKGGLSVDVVGVAIKPTADADSVVKSELTTSNESVTSDPAALVAGLTSPNTDVRLASVWRLTEVKVPEAVAPLLVMAKSANPLEAMGAIPALAFQDTEESWAGVRNQLVVGPFEANRRFAAQVLTGRLVAADVLTITPALAVRSWRTRMAVLDAIIPVQSPESSITLSGSLDDPYPQIRTRVVANVSLAQNIQLRRLIFTAVNDPSQYIRLMTYIRLIDVEDEAIRSDALKGVRDDALGVKLGLLAAMTANPKPHYRTALQMAVTDVSPQVRAAALEAFVVQPAAVDPAEISNTFSDADVNVQLALVKLAKSGQVALPAEVIQALKNSPHETVREAAKDLGS
jgi:HEAT repeat protein